MYQLGSFFIYGMHWECLVVYLQKYNSCWGISFSASKVFTSTKSYWFWYKGFINNSLKFCPRNFKNNEIDCTISQKKNDSELQKFKKGNVAAIWLCKKLWLRRPETFENELQKREHFLRIIFNVVRVVNHGLIFLLLDNTNYVMQNLIPKFRQSSIICEKPGYLSKKLKTLTTFN